MIGRVRSPLLPQNSSVFVLPPHHLTLWAITVGRFRSPLLSLPIILLSYLSWSAMLDLLFFPPTLPPLHSLSTILLSYISWSIVSDSSFLISSSFALPPHHFTISPIMVGCISFFLFFVLFRFHTKVFIVSDKHGIVFASFLLVCCSCCCGKRCFSSWASLFAA